MKVTYSRRAVSQINEAFDYIEKDNPAAARRFMLRVGEVASLLEQRPGVGRPTNKPGVHIASLQPFPYLMFYRVIADGEEIRVIRVRHMSRRDAADTRGL